jgi:ubiquinone/menaquinone biosynthesis C-methylase UbiE
MEITEATALIEAALPEKRSKTTWADLGCGSGLFTAALSSLVGDESKIYAVDKEFQRTDFPESGIKIEFVKLDFISHPLPFSNLDGILMANSLHYVRDKIPFAEKLKMHLKATGQIIIVEYDTDQSNQWVPYPLSFERLKQFFLANGFKNIEKTGERQSIYRTGKMYACSIKRS